jgi:hypothetical protein
MPVKPKGSPIKYLIRDEIPRFILLTENWCNNTKMKVTNAIDE